MIEEIIAKLGTTIDIMNISLIVVLITAIMKEVAERLGWNNKS